MCIADWQGKGVDEMNALGLDLGTTTGWAVVIDGNQIISGSESFKIDRFSGGGIRFLRFLSWLDSVQSSYPLGLVAYEEVRRHLGVDAAHMYGGFMYHLQGWCEKRKIPYEGVPVGTIKKHISGRGNANKRLIMDSVEKLGYNPTDHNEADAIAIAHWCLHNRLNLEQFTHEPT
jgi:crossover junction endodeoxyribonuclease RuvC